jgi:hypothetical protein
MNFQPSSHEQIRLLVAANPTRCADCIPVHRLLAAALVDCGAASGASLLILAEGQRALPCPCSRPDIRATLRVTMPAILGVIDSPDFVNPGQSGSNDILRAVRALQLALLPCSNGRPRRRLLQINGHQGSYTGTDDHTCLSCLNLGADLKIACQVNRPDVFSRMVATGLHSQLRRRKRDHPHCHARPDITCRHTFESRSQINGNNGSATNSDDVKSVAQLAADLLAPSGLHSRRVHHKQPFTFDSSVKDTSPAPTPLYFKYHGKYGGPGYTGGQRGGKDFSVPPDDLLDDSYRKHDHSYTVGLQRTGDVEHVKDVLRDFSSYSLKQKVKGAASALGFALKSLVSSDDLERGDYVGADDLPHKKIPIVQWSTSRQERNRAMHAANGNQSNRPKEVRKELKASKDLVKQAKAVQKSISKDRAQPKLELGHLMQAIAAIERKVSGKPRAPPSRPREALPVNSFSALWPTSDRRTGTMKTWSVGNDHYVRHCELLWQNIPGSVALTKQHDDSMNPALYSRQPWLSGTARNYEFYRYVKAWLHFDTGAGFNQASMGHIRLMPMLDVNHAAPTTTGEITSYQQQKSASPI